MSVGGSVRTYHLLLGMGPGNTLILVCIAQIDESPHSPQMSSAIKDHNRRQGMTTQDLYAANKVSQSLDSHIFFESSVVVASAYLHRYSSSMVTFSTPLQATIPMQIVKSIK